MTRRIERATPEGVADEYGAVAEGLLHEAIAARRPPGGGTITGSTFVVELLDRYIERCRVDGDLAAKSVDTYAATIKAVRPRFAGVRVSEADPALLHDILAGIRRDHGATRERHTKVALNAVFGDAVLARAVATNPVREIPARRRGKANRHAKGAPPIAADDLPKLLAALDASEACRQRDLRDPIVLLIATGLRRSELLGLDWGDVDLENKVLHVRHSVVRVKGAGLVRQATTKTGDERHVPLPRFAVEMLIHRRDHWSGPNDAKVVFPSTTGTLRDPDNFGKQWAAVRASLGFPDVSSHSFRKTVATVIDDSGLSARVGADQLGHARPSMTMDTYMARGVIHREVASALDKALGVSDE